MKLFAVVVLLCSLTGCEAINSTGKSVGEWASGLAGDKKGVPQAATSQSAIVAKTDAQCPEVKVLKDLSSITQFRDSKTSEQNSIIASAKLDNISATCQTSGKSVTLEISLDFTGSLGSAGLKDLNGQANYVYPYFISVITPSGQILSKDVFALGMTYENGVMTKIVRDRLRQTIPLNPDQLASQFQVVAGFQLSAEELGYNRTTSPQN